MYFMVGSVLMPGREAEMNEERIHSLVEMVDMYVSVIPVFSSNQSINQSLFRAQL